MAIALDWRQAALGDLCVPRKEFADVASLSHERYVAMEHVDSGTTALARWSTLEGVRSAKARFLPGDVLYGKLRPYLDKAVLAPWPGVCSTEFIVLKPQPSVDPGFLSFLLHHRSLIDFAVASTDGVNHPRTSWSSLSRFTTSMPPLDEQRRISAMLHRFQSLMLIENRRIQLLTQLKAATLAKLFREGLRHEPLKDSELGPIPQSWRVVPLRELAEMATGGTPSKANPEFWRGDIPWASPKDMKRLRLFDTADHISSEALERGSRLAPTGSIFIVVRGMVLAKHVPIGITEVPMAFNQDMKALFPTGGIDHRFLLYAIASRRSGLTSSISLTAHGTRRLESAAIANLRVPLPNQAGEQHDIASVLDNLDKLERLALRRLDRVTTLFTATLTRLMSGELRLPAEAASGAHA